MFEIIAVAVILISLFAGSIMFGLTVSIVYHLITGLIVGAVARFVVPGAQRMGWLSTSLYGIAGGALGGVIGRALHVGQTLQFALSIGAAAMLLTVFHKARR